MGNQSKKRFSERCSLQGVARKRVELQRQAKDLVHSPQMPCYFIAISLL